MGLRDLGSGLELALSELLRPSMRSQGTPAAPNEHSLRTCTAGTVALTPARCLLAEADTTLLKQYRSNEGQG